MKLLEIYLHIFAIKSSPDFEQKERKKVFSFMLFFFPLLTFVSVAEVIGVSKTKRFPIDVAPLDFLSVAVCQRQIIKINK